MKKQITIKDLAKVLGVAPSTVSRALHDHPKISAKTKSKVIELAQKLNYKPNEIALSLRNQRTMTIGVIIPEIIHFFFSTVISGIEEVAYANGYTVILCQSNESLRKEVLDTAGLRSHRVDGMLVSHSRETSDFSHFAEVMSQNIPVVFFDRVPDKLKAQKVIIDDLAAAKLATEHLIKQSCKRIAHLAGPPKLRISKLRKQGYVDALKQYNMDIHNDIIIDCIEGTKEMGYKSMEKLISLEQPPDGIFANNDVIAFGAMEAILDAGLKIPEDIAVIGFSNWQFSSLVRPALSSIVQPGLEMGRVAMQSLIEQLKGNQKEFSTQTLPVKLVIRASSNKNQN